MFGSSTYILDCTLRDGGFYNNWFFEEALVKSYIKSIEESGITFVEIGYRKPSKRNESRLNNSFSYVTEEYICNLGLPSPIKIGVMIDAKDFINKEDTIASEFQRCSDSRLDFVRIVTCSSMPEVSLSIRLAKQLKELGYICTINLMQISRESAKALNTLKDYGSQIEENFDVVYFADSFGNLMPEQVSDIINSLKGLIKKPIGFHAHDNLSLALVNSITAINNGAQFIDATVQGMGRGAGNLDTALILSYLKEKLSLDYNPFALTKTHKHFTALKDTYKWGVNYWYFLSGLYNIHPSYIQSLISKSLEEKTLHSAINKLKTSDDKHIFSEELLKNLLASVVHA